jgi:hypothetical protein
MGSPDETMAPATLSSYADNTFSQNGEDGILRRIFDMLEVSQGWCVEFGAWDGVYLSNTYNLIKNHGWRAVLIEADAAKFETLEQNARPYADVTCINRLVEFDPPNNLDGILAQTDAPSDLDLLSIDIDGNDYHVWEGLRAYRPKVVVIEFNLTIPNHIEFVQARDMAVKHGSSFLAMVKLGARKGYQLAAAPGCNAIFVRDDIFPVLDIADNSIDTIRPSREHETWILHLFDGTLALAGRRQHLWNGMELRESRIQLLPSRLRTYREDASPRMRLLQGLWGWWYKHRP